MERILRHILRLNILLAFLAMVCSSCRFQNTMSYPIIKGEILEFAVAGQTAVTIDKEQRTVNITLCETCDITAVKLERIILTENAHLDETLPDVLDLSHDIMVKVITYQSYAWTISATQPIDRHITVDNQVGDAQINLGSRIAVVYVSPSQNLETVRFTSMKLEPGESVVTSTTGWRTQGGQVIQEELPCSFPMVLNCVLSRTFNIFCNGQYVQWMVKVMPKAVDMEINSVNARCYHASVRATFSGEGSPGIQYRKASSSEWITAGGATVAGVGISVDITGLSADTDYVVRVADGERLSEEFAFRTEKDVQLDNMNFDSWWLDGKVYYPYAQGAERVWDSANKATAQFIGSSTTPEEKNVIKGKAARMESKYAMIAFAAGNIYTGTFCNIAGMGAELDWGTAFTSRPKSLKGWYNYQPKTIDRSDDAHKSAIGTMDRCQIQVLLTDWDERFHINTSKGIFVDFENDRHIIAYAKLESDKATDGYEQFELPLEYRDKERIPRWCVVVCASSYMGDYFTGGVGSVLYVDEFEFTYE